MITRIPTVPRSFQKGAKRTLVIFGLVANSLGDSSSADIRQDDPTVRIDFPLARKQLKEQRKSGDIVRMEVFHISNSAEFRTNVSSDMLKQNYDYKVVIKRIESSEIVTELFSVLEKVSATPSGRVFDLRWGCIFYGGDGSEAFSVYFGKEGDWGLINGACINFDARMLRQWAESSFARAFR